MALPASVARLIAAAVQWRRIPGSDSVAASGWRSPMILQLRQQAVSSGWALDQQTLWRHDGKQCRYAYLRGIDAHTPAKAIEVSLGALFVPQTAKGNLRRLAARGPSRWRPANGLTTLRVFSLGAATAMLLLRTFVGRPLQRLALGLMAVAGFALTCASLLLAYLTKLAKLGSAAALAEWGLLAPWLVFGAWMVALAMRAWRGFKRRLRPFLTA